MRVDNPLPRVPSQKEAVTLIMGTQNLKHRLMLAMAYGCALRMTDGGDHPVCFGDISLSRGLVMIRAVNSKNRCEETVELPDNLKAMLLDYYCQRMRGAKPDDWLFPGQKAGTHISKGTLGQVIIKRLEELGGHPAATFFTVSAMHMLFDITSPGLTSTRSR